MEDAFELMHVFKKNIFKFCNKVQDELEKRGLRLSLPIYSKRPCSRKLLKMWQEGVGGLETWFRLRKAGTEVRPITRRC